MSKSLVQVNQLVNAKLMAETMQLQKYEKQSEFIHYYLCF